MFYYADGSVVAVGDSVLIEDGGTPAVVDQVVRTSQEMQNWNVDEPGLMLASPSFGLIYYTESWLVRDPLKLVAHA